jgi:biopolymer transport protein ExbB/TolQ
MRQKRRHFPFAPVGLVLIAVSVAPTVIGVVRGFNQMEQGGDATATVNSGVALAFHPAFIACGLIGLLLVVVGIVLAVRRTAN